VSLTLPNLAQRGVVVDVTDAAAVDFTARLRNVANLRADLGAELLIEVVVHGPAVALLMAGSDAQPVFDALENAGRSTRQPARGRRR